MLTGFVIVLVLTIGGKLIIKERVVVVIYQELLAVVCSTRKIVTMNNSNFN